MSIAIMARRTSPKTSNDQQQYFDPFGVPIDPSQHQQQEERAILTFPPSESSSSPHKIFFQDDFGFPTEDPAWTVGANTTANFPPVAVTSAPTSTTKKIETLDTTTRTASTTNTASMNESLDYSSQDSSFNNSFIPHNFLPDGHEHQSSQKATAINDFRGGSLQQGFNDSNNIVFPLSETGITSKAFAPINKSHHHFIQTPSPIRKTFSPQQITQAKQHTATATTEATTIIEIKIEERLSIYLDDSISVPSCRVIGTISMKPISNDGNNNLSTQNHRPPSASAASSPSPSTFCLTIRDRKSTIERWEEQPEICKNITASLTHLSNLNTSDQVFRIVTGKSQQKQQHHGLLSSSEEASPIPIIAYSCHSKLKPIPVLVKTKVIRKEDRCRVGIRFRANPSNGYHLKDVTIVMVVPPDIDGENNVSISRKGGTWDVMKRTLSWMIPELSAGEVIDIQAQFQCSTPMNQQQASSSASTPTPPKFPVLVHCNGNTNFSKIHLETDYVEEGSMNHIGLKVEKIANIVYRKV